MNSPPDLLLVSKDHVLGLVYYQPAASFRCACHGVHYDPESPGPIFDIYPTPVGARFRYHPDPPTEAEVDAWVATGDDAALATVAHRAPRPSWADVDVWLAAGNDETSEEPHGLP